MTYFAISQVLIGLAFICDIASFQFRSRRAILVCLVASTVVTAIHFFFLGNQSAGFLMLLASARFSVASFSKRPEWMWFFFLVAVLTLFKTCEAPVNIVAFLASMLASFASFRPTDKELRRWMMLATSTWATHNVLIGSPAAVLLELFFLGSNIVGYWRFYLRPPLIEAVETA